MTSEMLYRVTGRDVSGSFCAAAVVKEGKVVKAPPQLKYCLGHPASWLEQYADLKRWTIEKVPMLPSDPDNG